MEKIFTTVILIASVFVLFCQGAILQMEEHNDNKFNLGLDKNDDSLLKCKSKTLVGVEKTTEFFENLIAYCNQPPSKEIDFNCIVETIGMTDEDGEPKLERISNVIRGIVSEEILNRVPAIKEGIDLCAVDFVTNYDQSDYDREDAAKSYLECLEGVVTGRYGSEKELVKTLCG